MKDKPSSPALSGDASDHPEGVSKEASFKEASGHPKIFKIEKMERKTAKLSKIIKIVKKIAVFQPLYATAEEIGKLIEVLQENGYEVKDDINGFAIYRVLLIPANINEDKTTNDYK